MWWAYLLTFFCGSIVGLIVMGLMAASRETEPHEVHVYCDEDGEQCPFEVIAWMPLPNVYRDRE